jgi:thioredoxin-like negative regulator of GroEL
MGGMVAADARLHRDFGDPAAWKTLIEAARQSELGETALLCCETRAKLAPDNVDATLIWIETLLAMGRPREALRVVQSLSQRHPQDAQVVAMLRRVSVAVTVQSGKLNSSADR